MKRSEVIALYRALNNLGRLSGVKFAYAVNRNIKQLQTEIDAVQKAIEPTSEFSAFEKERVKVAEEYAEKDGKGKPKVENGQYVFGDKLDEYQKRYDKLIEEHKPAVDAREKQIEDVNKLLDEEVEVNLYKIPLASVPEGITTAEMNKIMPIIDEPAN